VSVAPGGRPTFRAAPTRVRVPATSANLGPGFDAFGLALGMYDDVVAQVSDVPGVRVDVHGEGAESVPRDHRHLVAKAMLRAFDALGGRPRGLDLVCANRIPHGRGLGSSAAAIVSGILLARVLYVKQGGERNFVIVDAAMTDLIRPALYDAQHFIWPARLMPGQQPQRRIDQPVPGGVKVDVVGGVCESSDFLAKDRVLPPVARGDLLAVFTAGAYGFVMSSQYNSRPRAAEVLVEGQKWQIVRRRETYDDLLAAER